MKQPLPIVLALVILVLDYISLLMIICVAIGLYRAAKLEAFHTMQYSAGFQMICVVLLSTYDILSKHELIDKNWQVGYIYFDQPNVAITTTVWIQIATASLFHLICVPIYLSGLLQNPGISEKVQDYPSKYGSQSASVASSDDRDYISLFMNICVMIGLARAAKRETFHIMQHSAASQRYSFETRIDI
ncbi:hypothetical protein HDV06_005325 [Boothiomyces sp. JEL0866]|nr:hypothetical protein HDV06_005325 [Boothiomyces sp. JEL0866]